MGYICVEDSLRTWTSADRRIIEARYLELVGSKVRIENTQGGKFTVPLTDFSSVDKDYVKRAYGLTLFAEPLSFEDDDGRSGVMVASAKGRVG